MPFGHTSGCAKRNAGVKRHIGGTNGRARNQFTRIDWVFQRRSMPLQVIGEYGHWRRVIDRDGQGGWVHYTMLSGARSVIIDQDLLRLRARPRDDSRETVELEAGVIARLHECEVMWCRLSAGGYKGWAPKSVLWGVEAHELRD